ncbi:hypothetical protein [Nocardia cyriacigeorgica]|uniref:hypothetical protein n=1 Tax=Nocardia cyriacigeorgica TaxID=135487 RepID=UPI0024539B85|nr:hypothetical protein [Nocardia cyriacigeorgica]
MSTSEFFDPADSVRHRSCIQAGSLGVAILGGDSARWSHRHARASPSRDDGSLDGQRIDPPKKPPTLLAVQFDDAPPTSAMNSQPTGRSSGHTDLESSTALRFDQIQRGWFAGATLTGTIRAPCPRFVVQVIIAWQVPAHGVCYGAQGGASRAVGSGLAPDMVHAESHFCLGKLAAADAAA